MTARLSLLFCIIGLLTSVQCTLLLFLGCLNVNGIHGAAQNAQQQQKEEDARAEAMNATLGLIEALKESDRRNDVQSMQVILQELDKFVEEVVQKYQHVPEYAPLIASVQKKMANMREGIEKQKNLNATFAFQQEMVEEYGGITEHDIHELGVAEYCRTKGSLMAIALKMAHFSSPPGSPSYNKMKSILKQVSSFYIDLGVEIFDDVTVNIATMLKGYGLRQESSSIDREDVLRVQRTLLVATEECTASPRIILQTEQLKAVGNWYRKPLQECHAAPDCIIIDFSDYNYKWESLEKITDSVILLPTMIQSRLTNGEQRQQVAMKQLQERSLHFVFFAYMVERRIKLKQEIEHSLHEWNFMFQDNNSTESMVDAYRNAKVCLVAHAYGHDSGGEYHRLSEFATMGCVPVMETFSDQIAIRDYATCGGVVFTKYENLVVTVAQVLKEIDAGERDTAEHVEWWKRRIDWQDVLVRLFEENDNENENRHVGSS